MPRAPSENITHAGSGTMVVNPENRRRMASALVEKGFDKDAATCFVIAVNGIAAHAYELEAELSTRGSLIRWHKEALRAIERNDRRRIRKMLSDSQDEFLGRTNLESQLLANTGGLPAALLALKVHCETEIARMTDEERRTGRRRTERQIMTDELVYEWYTQFGDYPNYWIEEKWPPFPAFLQEVLCLVECHYVCEFLGMVMHLVERYFGSKFLKETLHLLEVHYIRKLPSDEQDWITEDAVHGLIKRATKKVRKRIARESQIADSSDRSL
jgi:hypothetical protein